MKIILSVALLILAAVIVISGCVEQKGKVTVKLTNVTGGHYDPSAGYYEGGLKFDDVVNGGSYSLFVCTKDWSWVRKGGCYEYDIRVVDENVKRHETSAMLSGCYVGNLTPVDCP